MSGCTRGRSRTVATSKVELFLIIVNGWKPLTIITKSSILDASAALDPPLWTNISQQGTTRKSHRHIQQQCSMQNFLVMIFVLIFYWFVFSAMFLDLIRRFYWYFADIHGLFGLKYIFVLSLSVIKYKSIVIKWTVMHLKNSLVVM